MNIVNAFLGRSPQSGRHCRKETVDSERGVAGQRKDDLKWKNVDQDGPALAEDELRKCRARIATLEHSLSVVVNTNRLAEETSRRRETQLATANRRFDTLYKNREELRKQRNQLKAETQSLLAQLEGAFGAIARDQTRLEMAHDTNLHLRDEMEKKQMSFTEAMDNLRLDLGRANDRVDVLQNHIVATQRTEATFSDEYDHATDENIHQEWADCFVKIQAWAFRMVNDVKGLTKTKLDGIEWMEGAMPFVRQPGMYAGGEQAYFLNVLVYAVTAAAVELHRDKPLFHGVPSNASDLAACLERDYTGQMPYLQFYKWRCATRDVLKSCIPDFFDNSAQCFVDAAIHRVERSLAGLVDGNLSRARLNGLKKVYAKMFQFFVDLHFHPARYEISNEVAWLPGTGHQKFRDDRHQDIGGAKQVSSEPWLFCGIAFPALLKTHGEDGSEIDHNVVSKAKVLRQQDPDLIDFGTPEEGRSKFQTTFSSFSRSTGHGLRTRPTRRYRSRGRGRTDRDISGRPR